MPELPDIPDGFWLEDAVAAGLQCGGNFVERSVTENEDGTTTLELDIITTRYIDAGVDSNLFEVKSGGWGFPEVFKLAGWMTFLDIHRAAFFVSRPPEERKQQRYMEVTSALNISLIQCPAFSYAELIAKLRHAQYIDDTIVISDANIELWRWLYLIDRILNFELKKCREAGSEAAARAVEYFSLVNDKIFFTQGGGGKVAKLYQGFQMYGTITQDAATEISPTDPKSAMDDALFYGKHTTIQSCLALLYRGRLGILKAAVDLIVETEDLTATLGTLGFLLLPTTFRNAIIELSTHAFVRRYPHFWQHFLWHWGGFIIESKRESEYQALSAETGVPVDELPNALRAFDVLFPTTGGWFRTIMGDLRIMMLFPPAYRGAGAFRRLTMAAKEEYTDLGLAHHVAGTLVAWHNASSAVLIDGRLPR